MGKVYAQAAHGETWEDAAGFRCDPHTGLMARSEVGEIWVFRERTAFFLSDADEGQPRRISPHAAVRPVIEGNWDVVDESLLARLVRQLESPDQ